MARPRDWNTVLGVLLFLAALAPACTIRHVHETRPTTIRCSPSLVGMECEVESKAAAKPKTCPKEKR